MARLDYTTLAIHHSAQHTLDSHRTPIIPSHAMQIVLESPEGTDVPVALTIRIICDSWLQQPLFQHYLHLIFQFPQ